MRHEAPFQYGDTGFWHYASVNRRGGHPIGYCTYECKHTTAEEAWEHYRSWMLDHLVEETYVDTQYICAVNGCRQWTQHGFGPQGDHRSETLCDEHRNRDTYEREFLPPGGGIITAWTS